MISHPRVSVIMSVFKEPLNWLRQSIDSILNQTFSNFEFIIICDNPGYTEGIDVLKEYAEKDCRLVLIFNEKNIGLTKSLNKGVSVARGEYIARMDADDISMPNRLDSQLLFMQENKDVDVCHTSYCIISENGEYKRTVKLKGIYTSPNFLFVHDMIAHPTVMFKTSLRSTRTPLYNETYSSAQDYDLWSFFLLNNVTIRYLPLVCLKYRESTRQISKTKSMLQESNGRSIRHNLIVQYYVKCGIDVGNSDDISHMFNSTQYIHDEGNREALVLLRYFFYYNMSINKPLYSLLYIFDRFLLLFLLPLSLSKHVLLSRFLKERWSRMEY